MNSWVLLTIAGSLLASGCRKPTKRQGDESLAGAGSMILPRKVTDADPAGAKMTFELDEKTGRSRALLVLRLDYFPEPRSGVTNLPQCYRSFPESFDVGYVVCDGKPEEKIPVLAKHLDQDCYTDPGVERVMALQPLVLPGCKRAALFVHTYEPRLRVDAEVRDVN